MNNFTRWFWGKGAGLIFLQDVRRRIACIGLTKKIFVKALLCLMVFFSGFDLVAQITYDWLGSAPDGNFKQGASGARWNPGGLFDEPPFGIVQFNNNDRVIMTNNVAGTWSQFKINFGAFATSSRTISGNTIGFFDFSNVAPAISNNSSATHTINFPILHGNDKTPNRLDINANSASLIFGSTIGPTGTGTRNLVGMGGNNISFNG